MMETKLGYISKRARENKRFKFNNLIHLVSERHLRECFEHLKKGKAAGIDGITLSEYGLKLLDNVADLVYRMKRMSYRPQPVRRVFIPKGGGKKRPLGIPTVEDKLVQRVFAYILEAIWEEDFLDISFGFRPGRGCHDALARLDHVLMKQRPGYIIDADIEGYFDNVDHGKIVDCLKERINDDKFLRYIVRMLKSGIMEGRNYHISDKGTPQGGVVSPILANIYLHYLLDLWFMRDIRPNCKGRVELIRYCDDFVICVEKVEDVRFIMKNLAQRLESGNLKLSKEKTRVIRFNRPSSKDKEDRGGQPGTFNFLGFTHYWEKSRRGFYKVGRRTECKRFNKAVGKVKDWLKTNRNRIPLKEIWKRMSQMLTGHYSYYGVSGNTAKIREYHYRVVRLIFKWLNRRSQKKSYNWEQFNRYERMFPLPKPKIYKELY
jgi:group II intron reverse transcriptase/maturase